MRMIATWRDSRVEFHNLHPNIQTLIPKEDAAFFWQPHILMWGVIDEDTYALSMYDNPGKMFVVAEKDGTPSTFEANEG